MSIYSLTGYRSFLARLTEWGFTLTSFDDFAPSRRVVALRHDIDADLEAAVAMAELEHDVGVTSTYFLMLRSPLYNLLNLEFTRYARRLAELGHWVGLHYDQNYDASEAFSPDETVSSIYAQAKQVEEVVGQEVRCVSFHQPSPELLNRLPDISPLISTYDFLSKDGYFYMTDSNRSDNFERHLSSLLDEETVSTDSLQVLVHPMWWFYSDDTTEQVWDRVFESNYRIAQQHVLKTERAYGTERGMRLRGPSL